MGRKRSVIALLLAICLVVAIVPLNQVEKYEASEKVGSELLELLGVTYEELIEGNFVDSGETFSCIIWLQDINIKEAVEAGVDAAEKTREEYSARFLFDYHYLIHSLLFNNSEKL